MPQQPGMGPPMAPMGQQLPDTPTRQQSMTMNVSLNEINVVQQQWRQGSVNALWVVESKIVE